MSSGVKASAPNIEGVDKPEQAPAVTVDIIRVASLRLTPLASERNLLSKSFPL